MTAPASTEARPVTKRDVVVYAKKTCKTCYGTGLYGHMKAPGGVSTERLCGCALRRFLKTGVATVDTTTGQLKFKPLTLDTLAALAEEPSE